MASIAAAPGLEPSVSTHNHSSTHAPDDSTFFHPHRQLELTRQHGGRDMTDVDV